MGRSSQETSASTTERPWIAGLLDAVRRTHLSEEYTAITRDLELVWMIAHDEVVPRESSTGDPRQSLGSLSARATYAATPAVPSARASIWSIQPAGSWKCGITPTRTHSSDTKPILTYPRCEYRVGLRATNAHRVRRVRRARRGQALTAKPACVTLLT